MKKNKIFTIVISLVLIIFVTTLFTACSSSSNYEREQQLIKETITTSYTLVARNSVDNTINFTNVLDKKAEIKIKYEFNNGVYFFDTVWVESGAPFSKTYTNGYSIASFSITILSLE